jgi:light-regulated signal transduction histidine kinase (bacteriophytochrome)
LRRELVETVIWAGNPNEAVSADQQGRLHPRTSFAAWHETVRGRSRPWSELELESASFLREQLLRVQDAQKLALANEALGVAREAQAVQSGRAEMAVTVLHDIGNAITGIGTRSAQLLAEPVWPETENLARLSTLLQSQAAALAPVLGERKAAAMGGLASALERSLRDREATLREHVRSLVNSVSHIQEILSVQRQYANQSGTGARSRVVLSELVHDAIAIQATALEKRAVELVRRLAADLPRLSMDRTRMVQVLGNLIQNACESFDSEEDRGIPRQLEISAENTERGFVRLTIKDTGPGFDPERAQALFERGMTTKAGGTGVGLASCRSTVESHGGRIWIESGGIGKGATVTLELPTGARLTPQSENQNA